MPAIFSAPSRGVLAAGLFVLFATTVVAQPPPPWEFRDGDRIVFVGDTFVEREQRYGYVETVFTLANPDKNLTFRNLGWSGDTVRGLSRAGFDPPAAGFRELVKQVTDAKPTVLVVGYGMAESFDGAAALPRFVEGYNAFLDAVAPLKSRLVLLSPLPHEAMAPPLPDPAPHNRELAAYAEAIGAIAVSRDAAFVDLFDLVGKARAHREDEPTLAAPDTDNGIHPTDLGFWRLASFPELGVKPGAYLPSKELKTTEQGVQFAVTDARLPLPASPATGKSPDGVRSIRVQKLKPGRYTLKVDGRNVMTKTAQEWAKGQALPNGPEADQVEKLREAIVAKNRLFFYRWRPQNITYLFGFRKHEQGRNAVEIPQFDPLVDAKEKEIAELRKPVQHTFELVRESEASR